MLYCFSQRELSGKVHESFGTDFSSLLNMDVIPGVARLSWWLSGKESTCQCRRCRFDLWVGKFPWRRKWQPIPVFLLGKSQGQEEPEGLKSVGLQKSWL